VLYGFANVLLEQKLSKFHSLTILTVYLSVMLLFSVTFRQILLKNSTDISLNFPIDKPGWMYLLLLGCVIFVSNFCYTSAFTSGGNVMIISSLLILTPVFAVIFRTVWVRETPNLYHVLGFIFAAIAVILVAKGNVSN